jgi:hypothetical protein
MGRKSNHQWEELWNVTDTDQRNMHYDQPNTMVANKSDAQ